MHVVVIVIKVRKVWQRQHGPRRQLLDNSERVLAWLSKRLGIKESRRSCSCSEIPGVRIAAGGGESVAHSGVDEDGGPCISCLKYKTAVR